MISDCRLIDDERTRMAAQTVKTPKAESTTRLAPRYRVLIHNDPVTTFDFVEFVLTDMFKKTFAEAASIAMEAHRSGVALVEVMGLEEAEFRVERAHAFARTHKYPLTFTIEPE